MRRIFVFGSTGMLGWVVSHYLDYCNRRVIPLARKDFDVLYDSVEDFAAKYQVTKEDVLINAIGVTNRHEDKLPEDVFYRVNSNFPKDMDVLAGRTKCKLLHVTTDCAYKGDMGGYWESLPGNCKDLYGLSKLKGEALKNGIVIRTSFIGVEKNHRYNLISWVIEQEGKSINGFTNHTWNGITTLQFAKIVERFLKSQFPKPGLYHLFSKRIVTKYELVEIIIRVFGLNIDLKLYQTKYPVLRHLTSEKPLCKLLEIPYIEDQLAEFKSYCETHKIQWKYT